MKTLLTAAATWTACRSARWYLDRSSRRDTEHLNGQVRLRALWNEGAAFSLPIQKKALPVVSVAVLAALLPHRKEHPVAVGLALGGGLSNLQERAEEGKVYDYLQFPKAPGPLKNYVYNLADLAIFAGGGLLLRSPDKKR